MASSLQVVMDALPFILGGTVVTVCAVAIALGMGLVFGVPLAVAQVYGGGIARRCVGRYVCFFRGEPISAPRLLWQDQIRPASTSSLVSSRKFFYNGGQNERRRDGR